MVVIVTVVEEKADGLGSVARSAAEALAKLFWIGWADGCVCVSVLEENPNVSAHVQRLAIDRWLIEEEKESAISF